MKKNYFGKIFMLAFVMIGIFSFSGIRAEAATATASVSGNWSDTATWGGNAVPTSIDDVIINHGVVLNVDTTAVCNTLSFTTINNVAAETLLNINGTNSLTVTGAINLAQAVTNNSVQSNNIIDVGAGTLSAGSIALKGVGQAQFRLTKITASTGTINVSGNITSMGTSSRLVLGSGTLNVGGTFMSGTAGTFTSGTSTVNFNANGDQTISPFPYSFYNVTLSGSGIKTLTNATINGVLSIEGSATTSGTYASVYEIKIGNPASKLVYTVGDVSVDISGLVINIRYSVNDTWHIANITADNITGFDSSVPVVGKELTITIGGKTATYNIDVIAPLSSDKAITSFKLRQTAVGVIDQENHTISVVVPYGTDVTNLNTTIEVSDGATVSPLSDVVQDFTNPVTYRVTAEDETYQDYIVTVNPITLDSIHIIHPADKLTYYIKEALDISGLVVEGTYSDTTTKKETITIDNIIGFDSRTPFNDKVLTITVGGIPTTYTVDIKRRPSSGGGSGGGNTTPTVPPITVIPNPAITTTPALIILGCDDRNFGFSTTTGQSCVGNTKQDKTITSNLISKDTSVKFTTVLKLSSKGEDVKSLQNILIAKGYLNDVADGQFGPKTKQAVIKFQLANGLVGDGVVGKMTQEKLK